MTTSLLTRIARLEAQPQTAGTPLLRYGWIDRLPSDYTGERHIAIMKRERTRAPNIEWCQFEERPGLGPPKPTDHALVICLRGEPTDVHEE
jgi:hypothetical protein